MEDSLFPPPTAICEKLFYFHILYWIISTKNKIEITENYRFLVLLDTHNIYYMAIFMWFSRLIKKTNLAKEDFHTLILWMFHNKIQFLFKGMLTG